MTRTNAAGRSQLLMPRRRRPMWWYPCIVAAWMLATRAASADSGARPILVLEEYDAARPPRVAALIASLQDALESHGFVAKPLTLTRVAGRPLPQPGIADADLTVLAISNEVDSGFHEYVTGKFQESKATLLHAIESIKRNPAVVIVNTTNIDVTFKAYATLSLCEAQLGDAASSVAAMMELIRAFPTHPIPRADFGPEGEKAYRQVAQQAQALGRGRLSVTVEDDSALIFVDDQFRGVGSAAMADLLAGKYQVFVKPPKSSGRAYDVVVPANDDARLDVSIKSDQQLEVHESSLELHLEAAERANEVKDALALSMRWASSDKVVIVKTDHLGGKTFLVATLYGSDSSILESAALRLDDASDVTIRALAMFLLDGTPNDRLRIDRASAKPAVAQPPATAPSTPRDNAEASPSRRNKIIGGTLVGVGLVALAGGSYVSWTAKPPSLIGVQHKYVYSGPGLAAAGVGGAAVCAGVYLWLRHPKHNSTPVVTLGSGGGIVGWSRSF